MSTEDAALIIPALNEEATIARVVREAADYFAGPIIVADNGSNDGTATAAAAAGACVVTQPVAGYGRACLAGVDAAGDARVLVFMDGDGSDVPADIPHLLAAIEDGADLALGVRRGARVEPHAIAPAARFGNWLACRLLGIIYGRRVRDLSPLKAIQRDFMERLELRELTYGWTIELIARSLEANARIVEVETGYRRRAGGQSKVSGNARAVIRAGIRILATIARVGLAGRPPLLGAAVGTAGALLCVVAFALWLATGEPTGARTLVAPWLMLWPLLLTGMSAGYALGAILAGSGRRTEG